MDLIPKPSGNVSHYFSGNSSAVHTHPSFSNTVSWLSLSIINDDSSNDLIFTVNNITITVKAQESYNDDFASFTTISIIASGEYRLVCRE